MADNFDTFPLNEPIVNIENKLTSIWYLSLSMLYSNLVSYLTNVGIIVPSLSDDQIRSLVNVTNGQLILNSTHNVPQMFINGSWRTFSLI